MLHDCDCLLLSQNRCNSQISLAGDEQIEAVHHNSYSDTESSVHWLSEMDGTAYMPETNYVQPVIL